MSGSTDNPNFSEKGTMELLCTTRYYALCFDAKQSAVLTVMISRTGQDINGPSRSQKRNKKRRIRTRNSLPSEYIAFTI